MSIGETTPGQAVPGQQSGGGRLPSRDSLVLAIACVAQFMVVLDVSIVTVALPSIGRELHYTASGLQWVVNAYVLPFAGFLLLGGRAADLFGRRRVYLFGLGLFTLASLVGGLAQNSEWLTTARAAQGIGGGGVLVPGHPHHHRYGFLGGPHDQGTRHLECRGRGWRRVRGDPRWGAHR